jgi:putative oxidoreductase
MGLLFLFASITYFFNLIPVPEMTGKMKTFNEGLGASGYIMPIVKTIELLCGLAFVSGRFVALASILIMPIIINILGVHTVLDTQGLPIALALFLFNAFLIYANWDKYRPLLASK